MDIRLNIFFMLLLSRIVYCSEECKWLETHSFEVKADTTFSFTAEIKIPDGLIIDIIYENETMKYDRILLSPHRGVVFKYTGETHIKKVLGSVLKEGLQNISIHIENSIMNVICASSDMAPVTVDVLPKIKNVKVMAANLNICEESCYIKTTMEKVIGNYDIFKITAFTAEKDPITLEISYSKGGVAIDHYVLKPHVVINPANETIPCDKIKPGWNILDVFVNKTTLSIHKQTILQTEHDLKTIRISGSYMVNCVKGTPMWKILNKEEIKVPIIVDQALRFGLTSSVAFSPVFNMNGNNLKLTWQNGPKFGFFGKQLQRNSYHIIFEAMLRVLRVYNKERNKQQLLLEIKVDEVPEFISFSSDNGSYLLTLSVQESDQEKSEPESITKQPLVTSIPSGGTYIMDPSRIIIILVIVVFTILIVASIFVWKKIKIKIMTSNNKQISGFENSGKYIALQMEIHVEEMSPSLSISRSSLTKDLRELVDSIKSFNMKKVKDLISSGKTTVEEALLEAHIRDNMEVVQAIMKLKDEQTTDFHDDKQIMEVMEVLGDRIDHVFSAIRDGKLYGKDSASKLLKYYGLPGTIRDTYGNSLLHSLVEPYTHNENIQSQFHSADQIEKFITEHKVLVAAVNYKGQTALHTLAVISSKNNDTVHWSKTADFLLKAGCDPRVRDNNDQLPEDIALDRSRIYLQQLLTETRIKRGEMDLKSKIDQWHTLYKDTQENNLEAVEKLLLENVPILPLSSTGNPLTASICRGNVDLTMLLLSAGAPLCGRPLVELNSLEISHSTSGITAFLPALIRREFYNCLKSETELFTYPDSTWEQLITAIFELSEDIKAYGYKQVHWNFCLDDKNIRETSYEARKLLRLAASVGMGLTCQMLGVEKVFLHPLPLEISPDSNAKPNTLKILCRDLELSLALNNGKIPSHLKKENEQNNLQKLRTFCRDRAIGFSTLFNEQRTNKEVLKYIAEQGLDTAYKKMFYRRNDELVNIIVDDITGFTMLHSAAYNGSMGMVEYLLLNKTDETIKTNRGFSAAHVAAMRGHMECMEYILAFSKLGQSMENDLTLSGLTARQISDGYASEVNNLRAFLLHESVSHTIISEPNRVKRTRLVLKDKKSIIKKCLNRKSLDYIIPAEYEEEQTMIWQQLKEESDYFIEKLANIDSRFKGKPIKPHRNENALELFLIDSYEIFLEIEKHETLSHENLHATFMEQVNKALQDYIVKSTNLCLVPPVFEPTASGVYVVFSYCSKKITTHISIHLSPVFKEHLDLNKEDLELSQMYNIAQTNVAHTSCTKSEKLTYITIDARNKLFLKLESKKLLVLSLCKLICKMLYPRWWWPKQHSRRHGRQWHHYAVYLKTVPEKLLISCFLREAFERPDVKWNKDNVLDRVIGVFNYMVMQDKNEEIVAKCVLDPGKEAIKVSPNVREIIDFLQGLKRTD